MRYIRFNIASLLVTILIIGFGFAALRESNDLWDSGIFSLTLGVLLTSILLAVHRKESRRAFWIGFAMFGWVYLGLSLVPSMESRLLTRKVLVYLGSKVPGRYLEVSILEVSTPGSGPPSKPAQNIAIITDGSQAVPSIPGQLKLSLGGWSGSTENFVRIGHSLLSLIVGLSGGHLSRQLSARTQKSATV